MTFKQQLGRALAQAREQKGWSQKQLAVRMKPRASLKYVGDIERGRANATLGMIERAAKALDWKPFRKPDGDLLAELVDLHKVTYAGILGLARRFAEGYADNQAWQAIVKTPGSPAPPPAPPAPSEPRRRRKARRRVRHPLNPRRQVPSKGGVR